MLFSEGMHQSLNMYGGKKGKLHTILLTKYLKTRCTVPCGCSHSPLIRQRRLMMMMMMVLSQHTENQPQKTT